MTKSEIKKQLNSYTKKQLVEALSDILSLNYDYNCPNCCSKVKDKSKYCSNCGQKNKMVRI